MLVLHTSFGPFSISSPAANILNSASEIDESFSVEADTGGDDSESRVQAEVCEHFLLQHPVVIEHHVGHLHKHGGDSSHQHVKHVSQKNGHIWSNYILHGKDIYRTNV